MSTDTPNLGDSGDTTPGARGVFSGGGFHQVTYIIEYLNIASLELERILVVYSH